MMALAAVMTVAGAFAANPKVERSVALDVHGVRRTMEVYVPENIEANRPLMISLHGRWGNGKGQKACAKFESIADTARFAVVFPDGLPQAVLGGGGNTGWDVGGETDSDIDFFKAIIDYMAGHYQTDRNRVYLSGFSIGGMQTYHAANVAADVFAAFASVGGYPLNEYRRFYTGKRPVPFMHIHGKNDGFVKVDSVPIVRDNWVYRNGCVPTPQVETVPDVYTREYYAPANGGFEYVYYALDGRGHEYVVTDRFNPSLEIWRFVSRHRLDDVCDSTLKYHFTYNKAFDSKRKVEWGHTKFRRIQLQPGTYRVDVGLRGVSALSPDAEITLRWGRAVNGATVALRRFAVRDVQDGDSATLTLYVSPQQFDEFRLACEIADACPGLTVATIAVHSCPPEAAGLAAVGDNEKTAQTAFFTLSGRPLRVAGADSLCAARPESLAVAKGGRKVLRCFK